MNRAYGPTRKIGKKNKMPPKNSPWNLWKPLMVDYVAAGVVFSQKNDPQLFGSPTRLTTLPQTFVFRRLAPYVWKPYTSADAPFFLRNMAPMFLEALRV